MGLFRSSNDDGRLSILSPSWQETFLTPQGAGMGRVYRFIANRSWTAQQDRVDQGPHEFFSEDCPVGTQMLATAEEDAETGSRH